jgi:uncharacterized 2Fe-2S/4Fe-4S cluster protein (DUF4445 family)
MSTLTLSPSGRRIETAPGAALRDVLFEQGVEFPCGGRGRCGKCRVKVLRGRLDANEEDAKVLHKEELAGGWRLACRHVADGDIELDLAQWEMSVLGDESRFSFTPRRGLGIAVDLGTTTIAAQLLDLETGQVLGARTALNAQTRHGDDVISRIEYALHGGGGELQRLVHDQIGCMVKELTGGNPMDRVVLVGNTVMHHLFCGLDVKPLATHPFKPQHPGRAFFRAHECGLACDATVEFLPCIGGMVGADILAGIVATGLAESTGLVALIDLGTNGEVAVAHCGRLVCTSTAAGPAFEGARIVHGMRAATGAISDVQVENGTPACRVIGGGPARGLCGSGLVDAVAAGLELGAIEACGRMLPPSIPLSSTVALYPKDVRELQLAKGAIAAGLSILTAEFGATVDDIERLYLAGAFGNYVNRASAHSIGLLRLPVERVSAAGNTALLGAKRALFEDGAGWDALAGRIEHIALHESPGFEDAFAAEIRFPD